MKTSLTRGSVLAASLCAVLYAYGGRLAAKDGAPVTSKYVAAGSITIRELCAAAVEESDNPAAGDPHDTTTPRAMVLSMKQVLTKRTLSDATGNLLIGWLIASRRGLQRIRAGLPQDWKAGDKIGTSGNGAIDDSAIAWPPRRGPILIAIYTGESKLPIEQVAAAHAEVGSALAQYFR